MTDKASGLIDEINSLKELLASARDNITARVIGQDHVVESALITMLCGGHALLVGAPGLAKTRLVETLGTVMGLSASRVQFTPDLMPADILGSEVLETASDGSRHFRFIEGPVFCQLLMADEINRASPRTQSALLQAMQEHEVTIAGTARALPVPFHVLATQNPIEQEGTYPLPEAQLGQVPATDRRRISRAGQRARHPARDHRRHRGRSPDRVLPRAVAERPDAGSPHAGRRVGGRGDSRSGPLGKTRFPRGRRRGQGDRPLGSRGPRAAQALMLATRARALVQGRLAPSIDDVRALARPVLVHRMALGFAARNRRPHAR